MLVTSLLIIGMVYQRAINPISDNVNVSLCPPVVVLGLRHQLRHALISWFVTLTFLGTTKRS